MSSKRKTPKVGEAFTRRGQRYWYLRNVPHVFKNGGKGWLPLLSSFCADCGELFTFSGAPEVDRERWA